MAGLDEAAFSAFYEAIDQDPNILAAVFGRTNEASFDSLYNQFLPDYAGGIFQGLALGARSVMRAQAEEDKGVLVVMAGIKGSGAYSNFALEAGGEIGDLYRAYMARLVVRFLF